MDSNTFIAILDNFEFEVRTKLNILEFAKCSPIDLHGVVNDVVYEEIEKVKRQIMAILN